MQEMEKWAELHDELTAKVNTTRPEKGDIWCKYCEHYVNERDLKIWTGDDSIHHLCPGCDDDLLPVERMEE